jgi:hypothetical protein
MEMIIPTARMSDAASALNRLYKIGEKMGKNVQFSIEDTEPKTFNVHHGNKVTEVAIPQSLITLTVDGGASSLLKHDGAEFVARIEVTESGQCIIYKSPSYEGEIPEEWYSNFEHRCDHCHHQRRRVNYFLVEKDNQILQVGSTCVKEFLGIRPEWILSTFKFIKSISSTNNYDDDWWSLRSLNPQYNVRDIAKMAASVILTDKGYYKHETAIVTQTLLGMFVFSENGKKEFDEVTEEYNEKGIKDQPQLDMADFRSFVEHMSPSNYSMNLKAIVSNDWLEHLKWLNTLVSGVYIYLRDSGLLGEKEPTEALRARLNEWVDSQVGKRINFSDVLPFKRMQFEGAYGEVTMYLMLDADGRTLIWYSSRDIPQINDALEQKVGINLAGSIKRFDTKEYKGQQQKSTILTRVRVLA